MSNKQQHSHPGPRANLGEACAACALLDGVDGTIDGTFGPVGAVAKSEHGFRSMVKRAENRSADRITSFAGSMKFVYIHIAWFVVWISLNVGLAGIGWEFDKFPFGLLTMIVSLEAIFLATFVMISQNRSAARADLRSELDLKTTSAPRCGLSILAIAWVSTLITLNPLCNKHLLLRGPECASPNSR
jgi:Protein of unknown function (DUF1003)